MAAPHTQQGPVPSPSKVPANSPTSALEGLGGAWGALSGSGSILGSGPRVSTDRLCRRSGHKQECPEENRTRPGARGALPGSLGPATLLREPNPLVTKIEEFSSEQIQGRGIAGGVVLAGTAASQLDTAFGPSPTSLPL